MTNKKIFYFILGAVLIMLLNCSVYKTKLNPGVELYKSGDYHSAIEYFEKFVEKNPKSSEGRMLLLRSKLTLYYHYLALARKYKQEKNQENAREDYEKALAIFPNNRNLINEFNEFFAPKSLPTDPIVSVVIPPVQLEVNAEEKISLDLRSSPITKIFKMLGKPFAINFVFDKDFRDFVYSIEINNSGFFEILNQLCLVANVKYRVIDKKSVLIYPDTTFKRRSFDLKGIKVFSLSNVKADDIKKLLMTIFRDEQILVQVDPELNYLIVKASEETLQFIEKFIHNVDKEKAEVELDLGIMEVNRNLIRHLGADYGLKAVAVTGGVAQGDDKIQSTVNFNELGKTNFFINIPSVALSILESDDSNKLIAKPNLRGISGEVIKFMVGDEIPIPQTQFQAVAAGGVNNSPVTTYRYQNVGVVIELTPFIHSNNEVTIRIKLTMNFVSAYFDGIFPILGKRELENVIRLKEGETNLIGGFIKDEMRGSLNGLPALSKLPLLGKLFGKTQDSLVQTDLIFSITPRIIRKVNFVSQDLQPIWTNSMTGSKDGDGESVELESSEELQAPMASQEKVETNNIIFISPFEHKSSVDNEMSFSIMLKSTEELSSISISGSISGEKGVVQSLETDFSDEAIKVLKSASGNSFDLGVSFLQKSYNDLQLGRLIVKCAARGKYSLRIDSVIAYNTNRQQIEFSTSGADIDII